MSFIVTNNLFAVFPFFSADGPGTSSRSLRGRILLGFARETAVIVLCGVLLIGADVAPADADPVAEQSAYRSPNHLLFSPDGARAFVVNRTSGTVSVVETMTRAVVDEIAVGDFPTHAVVTDDGNRLFVTRQYAGKVEVVDLRTRAVVNSFPAGLEPYSVAYSKTRKELYVAASVSESLIAMGSDNGTVRFQVPLGREPRYLALSPDDAYLVAGGGLSRGVLIIDAGTGAVLDERKLGRASLLRNILFSPDGRWAFVAHVVSHDEKMTSQMERGWIHSNGFTVLDLAEPGHRVTLLLDRLLDGAANPWGLALSPTGDRLYVSLAGVNEVAIVDLPKALALVAATAANDVQSLERDVTILEQKKIARRVPSGGHGPRGIAVHPGTGEVWIAHYFDDMIAVLSPDGELLAKIYLDPSGKSPDPSLWREGERLFNDASLCFQRWFSCASCHQEDATMDGLNWDLANDGFGNPKNAKSLRDAVDTPPAMWTGVRKDIDAAVAAGQRFLGHLPRAENHEALVAFLSDPPRAPNPYRERFPEAIERGREIFVRADCETCHLPPTYVDGKLHDLGFRGPFDQRPAFDTPTLREVYRTGPYLHDGRAETLEAIFTEDNPEDRHGRTSGLTPRELEDLLMFVRSR